MTRKLAIIGAGGHGCVVADAAELSEKWDEIVFFDDYVPAGTKNAVWEVIGPTAQLVSDSGKYTACVVAIGDNVARLIDAQRLQQLGLSLTSVIHPAASVSRHCQIDNGCVVFAGAVVNIGSRLGLASIVNNAATVNHDCIIGSGVHVGPNAALGGNVTVGQTSWIGIGASVRQGIRIGSAVVVGAGAAVVSDIENNRTVVGVPAR